MALARRRLHHPLARVEPCTDHFGVEAVVPPQVVPVGDMVEIREDLGLRREPLRPRPLVLQVFVERVGVVDTFDVAARTGIPVPVPGAADARRRLDSQHRQALRQTAVHRIQPGEPGTDHNHVRVHTDAFTAVANSRRMSDHSSCRPADPAEKGMIVRNP